MLNDNINFELINNLTINTVQSVRDRLLFRIQNNESKSVVVDLSGVESCDTSGIAFLVDLKKQCHRYSKDLQFTKIPQKITDLANFYEVGKILNKGL